MKKSAFVFALALALAGCSARPSLVILHTNDTHSHLDAERAGKMTGHGGAIERAAFIDSVRCAMGEDRVLLLHAGDFNQGTSYYTELGGSVEVDVVNAMRYDCLTLGNHEFDNGLEDLCGRLARINCPVVCANIGFADESLYEYVKPFTVIGRGGKKIGIIGMAPKIKNVVKKSIADKIIQLDEVSVLNACVDSLRRRRCDMIILLSHMGYKADTTLVPHTAYIDLVVGGHSHTFVDDILYVKDSLGRNVGVVSDGCWGLEMGEIKVY